MMRRSSKFRVSALMLNALVVFAILGSGFAAHAGDADGVQGYSMRLKNKNINDGTGSGSGGPNVTVEVNEAEKRGLQEPQMTNSPIGLTVSTALRFQLTWMWMILKAR